MNMPWDHEPYSDGAEVGGLGIHEALQRKERDAHAEVGFGVLWVHANGGFIALESLLMIPPAQTDSCLCCAERNQQFAYL